jgi:hypothetical protein
MKTLQAAVLGAALGIAAQAGAALFDITLSGGAITGSGQLTATPNGDGTYTAISGSLQLAGGGGGYDFTGATGALVPNPNPGPNPAPWTQRIYGGTDWIGLDDKLFPGQTPVVDVDGLLFNDTSFPRPGGSQGLEFNLYYVGGSYTLLVQGNGYTPYSANYSAGTVTLTAVAVPEPATMIAGAGALGLVLLGAGLHSKRSGVLRAGR